MSARQECYREVVNGSSRRTRAAIARYFGFQRIPRDLWRALEERDLCQADVVLALLRMDLLSDAERLVGRPITHCPAALRSGSRTPVLRAPDPVVAHVVMNPRHPGTDAHRRFEAAFRVGRTIAQCRTWGARRRDVRRALRRGWISLTDGRPA